jgi:hypothetical protein
MQRWNAVCQCVAEPSRNRSGWQGGGMVVAKGDRLDQSILLAEARQIGGCEL